LNLVDVDQPEGEEAKEDDDDENEQVQENEEEEEVDDEDEENPEDEANITEEDLGDDNIANPPMEMISQLSNNKGKKLVVNHNNKLYSDEINNIIIQTSIQDQDLKVISNTFVNSILTLKKVFANSKTINNAQYYELIMLFSSIQAIDKDSASYIYNSLYESLNFNLSGRDQRSGGIFQSNNLSLSMEPNRVVMRANIDNNEGRDAIFRLLDEVMSGGNA